MDFYLVRHGEALSESQDARRQLSPRGQQAVEWLSRMAAERKVQPAIICHSGILRAKQTAEILAGFVVPVPRVETMAGLLPEDDPWIAKAELDGAKSSAVLVGHLPHLNRLAGLLMYGDPERRTLNFMPAMMVCFSRDGNAWHKSWELSPDSA